MDPEAEGDAKLSSDAMRCMTAGRKTQADLKPQGTAVSTKPPRSRPLRRRAQHHNVDLPIHATPRKANVSPHFFASSIFN